ncbi:MAG: trypsin-like peptidase domain-containing protein [Lachnospira sp.]|nr:trypsin-like peptidase domain-containing protein [Lachnospira sp.]
MNNNSNESINQTDVNTTDNNYNQFAYGQPAYTNNAYNQQFYSYGNNTANTEGEARSYSSTAATKKKKEKKSSGAVGRFFKKVAIIIASGVLFGAVAGGVMVGIYHVGVPQKEEGIDKETTPDIDIPLVGDSISSVSPEQSDSDGSAVAKMDVSAVAEAVMPAMVALQGTVTTSSSSYPFGGYGSYESKTSGTGIIVGKNDTELLVLTNHHVIDDVNNLECVFADGKTVSCVVKGSKADKDIAVVAVTLKDIEASTLKAIAIAELGDSDSVVLGQEVVAIGNALGEGQSVTDGIISAINRSITVDNVTFEGLFMTNAAINSGNSGGALLNADGKVIAVNFAKTSSDGVEGMAYSIPVSNIRDLIDTLMNKETRKKVSAEEASSMGISGVDITSALSSYYGFPQGVQIRSVVEGSAAQKAGLDKYDIIVGFDDQTVSSMAGLQSILQYYKAGETVKIEYYQLDGNKYVLKTVDITLDKKNK